MSDAFTEYAKATQVPQDPVQKPKPPAPQLPGPDSPEAIPEKSDPPPKVVEKVVEVPKYVEKIIEVPKEVEKIIEVPKEVEKKRVVYKDVDMGKPIKKLLDWLPYLLVALVAWWLWNNRNPAPIAKVPEPEVRTVYETKWKTKWKTRTKYRTKWKTKTIYKDRVIEKPVVREVSDTALLMKLKKENAVLRSRLASMDKQIELHKLTIRKFFRDPRRRKITVETRRSR